MTANQIQKYSGKSLAQLIVIAQRRFNKFIRVRDTGKPCINCGKPRTLQAGHFYPTSDYSHLRFNEDNVHGECLQCNYFNSQSHSYGYRVNLENRIGKERFAKLELLAKTKCRKQDRFTLIDVISKYPN